MTVLLEKLNGLFSGSIILSGLLPALITMAYVAAIVARFDAGLVANALQTQLTVTTLVTVLAVVVLTFVFETIHPLLRRWLTGGRVPEWWLRRRQRQRRKLEIADFQAQELWHLGTQQIANWRDTVRAQLGIAEHRVRGPAGTEVATRALAIRDEAEACLPRPEDAAAELHRLFDRLMGVVSEVEEAEAPWPEDLVWACRVVIMAMSAVEGRFVDNLRKTQERLRTPFPSNEFAQGTLFGNLVAAVEAYPATHYGMEAAVLWPRLRQAASSSDKWKAVDDSRSMVDFLVAAVWIHVALLAFTLLALPTLVARDPVLFVALIVLAVTLRFVFYRAALQAVQSYGMQVATAFDLHRWALLDALRLPRPSNPQEEIALWRRVGVDLLPASIPRARWYR
jgi:hypothetical protein